MRCDRYYLIFALCYAIAGMSLGIHMAITHNFSQHPTHAHLLLVGFVASFIYAVIHKLWLEANASKLAIGQFILHHAGAVTMVISLFLLFSGTVPEEKLEPGLAGSSIAVLTGVILMLVLLLKTTRR